MTAHTPGPWRHEAKTRRGARVWDQVKVNGRGDTSTVVIADVRRARDAALIAAAPELAQCLQGFTRNEQLMDDPEMQHLRLKLFQVSREALRAAGLEP